MRGVVRVKVLRNEQCSQRSSTRSEPVEYSVARESVVVLLDRVLERHSGQVE